MLITGSSFVMAFQGYAVASATRGDVAGFVSCMPKCQPPLQIFLFDSGPMASGRQARRQRVPEYRARRLKRCRVGGLGSKTDGIVLVEYTMKINRLGKRARSGSV